MNADNLIPIMAGNSPEVFADGPVLLNEAWISEEVADLIGALQQLDTAALIRLGLTLEGLAHELSDRLVDTPDYEDFRLTGQIKAVQRMHRLLRAIRRAVPEIETEPEDAGARLRPVSDPADNPDQLS